MHARVTARLGLMAMALWALGWAEADGQTYSHEMAIGSRIYGPPPSDALLNDTFTAAAGHGLPWHGGSHWHRPPYVGYGYYGYSGGWSYPWGYGGWGYGAYGGWYRPYLRPAPVILPPIVIPAEEIFGPAAAARMIGVDLFARVP